jgi:membrane protein implicated in regulation of membrane protease activity
MSPRDLPPRIDRAALERIIQRAAELQTGEREIGDSLTADEVVQLGRDVGIPDRFLRQAMLEEQTRIQSSRPAGPLDSMVGPATVWAERVVRGSGAEVEGRILRWMDDQELLAVQRQQPGWITWEPLRGMQVALRRSAAVLGTSRRPFMLQRANLVTALITDLEPGYCHVVLSAELRGARASALGGAASLVGVGVAACGALAVMTPFWWFAAAPFPLALGLAYGITRRFRPVVERTRLGLERAMDHLERGEVKPSHALPPGGVGVFGAILDEVRRALRP